MEGRCNLTTYLKLEILLFRSSLPQSVQPCYQWRTILYHPADVEGQWGMFDHFLLSTMMRWHGFFFDAEQDSSITLYPIWGPLFLLLLFLFLLLLRTFLYLRFRLSNSLPGQEFAQEIFLTTFHSNEYQPDHNRHAQFLSNKIRGHLWRAERESSVGLRG